MKPISSVLVTCVFLVYSLHLVEKGTNHLSLGKTYLGFTFQEKEEKLDGDAALNKFFQGIYQDADDDTRRAMRKSFVRLSFLPENSRLCLVCEFRIGKGKREKGKIFSSVCPCVFSMLE